MSLTHFEIYGEEPAKLADFYRNVQACNLGVPILAEELENRQRFK
jgi:hypothetical protein